jgi:hypothetical protein
MFTAGLSKAHHRKRGVRKFSVLIVNAWWRNGVLPPVAVAFSELVTENPLPNGGTRDTQNGLCRLTTE